MELPEGAKVGTGSLRRRSQLLSARPDLWVEPVRGNVDTRVRKLLGGDYDALVLAAAGLIRSGAYDGAIMRPLETIEMLPAAGQGALALQCQRTDLRTQHLLEVLEDPTVRVCVELERGVVAALDGNCSSPIGAYAFLDEVEGRIILQAAVGARGGGTPVVRAAADCDANRPEEALNRVLCALASQGAPALLHGEEDEEMFGHRGCAGPRNDRASENRHAYAIR
jgi:hydroxymethylbilane synthase